MNPAWATMEGGPKTFLVPRVAERNRPVLHPPISLSHSLVQLCPIRPSVYPYFGHFLYPRVQKKIIIL